MRGVIFYSFIYLFLFLFLFIYYFFYLPLSLCGLADLGPRYNQLVVRGHSTVDAVQLRHGRVDTAAGDLLIS